MIQADLHRGRFETKKAPPGVESGQGLPFLLRFSPLRESALEEPPWRCASIPRWQAGRMENLPRV